ncbi:MAG: hypothetical protein ACREFR_12680 [Limisphaerales bacterium]
MPIEAEDYLEWQIGYDNDSPHEPSVLQNVVLNKPQGVRYANELSRLLFEAGKLKILPEERFLELKSLVSAPFVAGIEESERIEREGDPKANTIATQYGFTRHYLRVPNYIRAGERYAIEIKIAHKQKAVGNQAMVYVHLPLRYCQSRNSSPLVGRVANKLEKAD